MSVCDLSAKYQLFPPENVDSWAACESESTFVWGEHSLQLSGLSDINRRKLDLSSGFCPHARCQVPQGPHESSSTPSSSSVCLPEAQGERGACFEDNAFVRGEIIAYMSKMRPGYRPIYKNSHRVVLGTAAPDDVREEVFINAAEIFPGLIASQCPLTESITNAQDVMQLILERRVALWVQLAPEDTLHEAKEEQGEKVSLAPPDHDADRVEPCRRLPDGLMVYDSFKRVSMTSFLENIPKPLLAHPGLDLSAFSIRAWQRSRMETLVGREGDGLRMVRRRVFCFDDACMRREDKRSDTWLDAGWLPIEQHVLHAHYGLWRDFHVPEDNEAQVMRLLAEQVASVLQQHSLSEKTQSRTGSAVVSCLSGRGRAGTFASIVAAIMENVTTHAQLVDVVVSMREARDSIVETPSQYRFASLAVGLPDPTLPLPLSHPQSFPYSQVGEQSHSVLMQLHGVFFLLILAFGLWHMSRLVDGPQARPLMRYRYRFRP